MKMAESSHKRVENTVGQGEIAPIPTVFSTDFYSRHLKTRAFFGKLIPRFSGSWKYKERCRKLEWSDTN